MFRIQKIKVQETGFREKDLNYFLQIYIHTHACVHTHIKHTYDAYIKHFIYLSIHRERERVREKPKDI